MNLRKIIPVINTILFLVFVYHLFFRLYPMFEDTPEASGVFFIFLISSIALGIAVLITYLLYWFNIGGERKR